MHKNTEQYKNIFHASRWKIKLDSTLDLEFHTLDPLVS